MLAMTIAKNKGCIGIEVRKFKEQLNKWVIPVWHPGLTITGQQVQLQLDKYEPPIIEDGVVKEISLKKMRLRGDRDPNRFFYVVTGPSGKDEYDFIVRINTYGAPMHGSLGTWLTVQGSPMTMVSGVQERGVGRSVGISKWMDGLVGMNSGDIVRVVWEGRKYPDLILICTNDNHLTYMSDEEFFQRRSEFIVPDRAVVTHQ
jgi:hypothetical protein